MNPEGLPFFINPFVLRTPPLYFALQNTGEEGNPLLIAVRYPAYGARQGEEFKGELPQKAGQAPPNRKRFIL